MEKKYVCIPRSFLVINVWNQGNTLCSPCIFHRNETGTAPVCLRISIKSFPDYKHVLQENYLEYKHIFFSKCNSTLEVFFLETNLSNGKKYVCIPRSFLAINVCNQGKTLCSPCLFHRAKEKV